MVSKQTVEELLTEARIRANLDPNLPEPLKAKVVKRIRAAFDLDGAEIKELPVEGKPDETERRIVFKHSLAVNHRRKWIDRFRKADLPVYRAIPFSHLFGPDQKAGLTIGGEIAVKVTPSKDIARGPKGPGAYERWMQEQEEERRRKDYY